MVTGTWNTLPGIDLKPAPNVTLLCFIYQTTKKNWGLSHFFNVFLSPAVTVTVTVTITVVVTVTAAVTVTVIVTVTVTLTLTVTVTVTVQL